MRHQFALAALAAAALAACDQHQLVTGPAASATARLSAIAVGAGDAGAVFTLTNRPSGNAVTMFSRAADGTLTAAGTVATGGAGTGAGLGSQSALALSGDARWLFAVNAGSNDVSVFRVSPAGPSLTARVPSGGTQPISVTVHGDLVYVLNGGADGNITGFVADPQGGLTPIPGSTRPLSGAAVGPAEVTFSPNGRWLVVTEKNTNVIDVYAVGRDGAASGRTSAPSAGGTPFGFAFGLRGELFVSEAAGTASSYVLGSSGGLTAVSGAVATHQGAPCWLVATNDGRFAYTANAHSGTISGFAVATDGSLSLLDPDGQTATVGGGNIDLALSSNGRYLYQLNGSGTISTFHVQADGHLAAVGATGGLPAGVAGLAAR